MNSYVLVGIILLLFSWFGLTISHLYFYQIGSLLSLFGIVLVIYVSLQKSEKKEIQKISQSEAELSDVKNRKRFLILLTKMKQNQIGLGGAFRKYVASSERFSDRISDWT